MSDRCELREGETRDDTHTSRNEAQVRMAKNRCPNCGGQTRVEGGCRTCQRCPWGECNGGKA